MLIRIGNFEPYPFDADEEVVKVRVPSTNTKKDFGYVTFLHSECIHFISEYLRVLQSKGYNVEVPNFILIRFFLFMRIWFEKYKLKIRNFNIKFDKHACN